MGSVRGQLRIHAPRVNPTDNGMYCDPCLQRCARCKLEFHYMDTDKVAYYRCERSSNHVIRIADLGA